jgi:SAM-dependent methyltransferase
MPDRPSEPLEATLQRLKDERLEADRRYHDALTALDRALQPPAALPDVPEPFDEHQITPLNESWNILPSVPQGSGLRGRLIRLIWSVVAPYLQQQLTFNSRVVDHVNRNAAAAREAHRVTREVSRVLQEQAAALAQFQSRLIVYLQQITLYVDTKDRDTAGGALVLNAALSGVSEELAKRWESMVAREQRNEARTASIAAAQEDLRAMVGVAQHATLVLKRELERIGRSGVREFGSSGVREFGSSGERELGSPGVRETGGSRDAFAPALDAYKYVGFENQFRGSREVIRERLESYLPYFEGKTDVLDVGCGRGEFLDLLHARGIAARGIDLNHEMAEVCRARGLDVTEADAVGYLSALEDGSLGGIFAAQVVEHLQPGYLLRFLELAFLKLRPGGRLVLETLNPACWVAFFESYIRDITHAWPLHPETLKYLVVASGFTRADIEFRSPVPPQDRLQPIAAGRLAGLDEVVEAFNGNVDKLNARMFTFMDYAVVAQKAAASGGSS